MREIRLSGSEGGEGFNPLSLPLSLALSRNCTGDFFLAPYALRTAILPTTMRFRVS